MSFKTAAVRVNRLALWACVIFGAAGVSGCNWPWAPPALTPEQKRFFDLPIAERHRVFREWPPETQIEYMHLAQRVRIPPDVGFMDDLAESPAAIEVVARHLRTEADDNRREELCDVALRMSARGSLSRTQRSALVADLRDALRRPGARSYERCNRLLRSQE